MIHVDRREFTATLQRACKVANGLATPGSGALQLTIGHEQLCVRSTNYEQSITEVLPVLSANGDAPGVACPNSRALLDLVRGLPRSTTEVTIGVDDRHITIGRACLKPGVPTAEFPVVPPIPKNPLVQLELSENIKELLAFLRPAAATERSRYTLNSICIDFRQGNLVACDGRRLHCAPLGHTCDLERVLVPLHVFKLGTPTRLVVSEQSTHVFFHIPNGYISSLTLEGTYPEYMGIVRDAHSTRCTVRKADLLSALNQIRPTLDAEAQGIDLGIGSSLLLTPAHLRGADRWSLEIEAVTEGADGHACLDARYLTDAIKHLPAEHVGINYTAPTQSIEFVADTSDAWAIIMPITLPQT